MLNIVVLFSCFSIMTTPFHSLTPTPSSGCTSRVNSFISYKKLNSYRTFVNNIVYSVAVINAQWPYVKSVSLHLQSTTALDAVSEHVQSSVSRSTRSSWTVPGRGTRHRLWRWGTTQTCIYSMVCYCTRSQHQNLCVHVYFNVSLGR